MSRNTSYVYLLGHPIHICGATNFHRPEPQALFELIMVIAIHASVFLLYVFLQRYHSQHF